MGQAKCVQKCNVYTDPISVKNGMGPLQCPQRKFGIFIVIPANVVKAVYKEQYRIINSQFTNYLTWIYSMSTITMVDALYY